MLISQKLRIGFIHILQYGNTTIQPSKDLIRKISGQSKKLLLVRLHSWTQCRAKRLLTRCENRYGGFPEASRKLRPLFAATMSRILI